MRSSRSLLRPSPKARASTLGNKVRQPRVERVFRLIGGHVLAAAFPPTAKSPPTTPLLSRSVVQLHPPSEPASRPGPGSFKYCEFPNHPEYRTADSVVS